MIQRSTSCTKDRSECIIALGSNQSLNDNSPRDIVQYSIERLALRGVSIIKKSRFYKSLAFPIGSGPDFVNAVILAKTELSATDLLVLLHEIEQDLGRQRKNRWEPRTLDLDLIDFAQMVLPDRNTYDKWANASVQVQQTQAPDQLILPHPRLQDRAFVLVPMADVAPNWVHPVTGRKLSEMIDDLPLKLRQEITML